MISLNIISQELKNEIKQFNFYKSLKNFFYILTICVCFYSIVLLVSSLILNLHLMDVISNISQLTKTSENYSKKIRDINIKIGNIEEIQKDTIIWSGLLEFIIKKTNNKIIISRIVIDQSKNNVQLTGIANTRDDLIEFKKIFDNEKFFSTGELPISSYLEKTNVNFDLVINLKSYEFEKL